MGYYVLPSTSNLILISLLFFSVLMILTLRFLRKIKKIKDFKSVVSKAKYTDPFMDFNIEMRDLSSQKKKSALFLIQLEDSLTKLFYRVFNEPVSLNKMPEFVRKLKGLGLEPHEIRSFNVLDEEYNKFKQRYNTEMIDFYEFKKAFIDQAKKTVNKLKRYSAEGDE